MGDWTTDAPGVRRKITVADLPPPCVVKRPDGAWPKAPAGFKVEEFLWGLDNPRLIRAAPGDIFLAESRPGRIPSCAGSRSCPTS